MIGCRVEAAHLARHNPSSSSQTGLRHAKPHFSLISEKTAHLCHKKSTKIKSIKAGNNITGGFLKTKNHIRNNNNIFLQIHGAHTGPASGGSVGTSIDPCFRLALNSSATNGYVDRTEIKGMSSIHFRFCSKETPQ